MKVVGKQEIVVPTSVLEAVASQDRVDEPPHNFYKYPARFSPVFAREVIKAFTRKGDTVIDPFCGGGTSLVEAISLGRRAAGFDISSLAVFLTRTKTSPLSVHDKKEISAWLKIIGCIEEPNKRGSFGFTDEEVHYRRNLPETARTFFESVIEMTKSLPKNRQKMFVRLVLLAIAGTSYTILRSI
jgi:hypothetical protein